MPVVFETTSSAPGFFASASRRQALREGAAEPLAPRAHNDRWLGRHSVRRSIHGGGRLHGLDGSARQRPQQACAGLGSSNHRGNVFFGRRLRVSPWHPRRDPPGALGSRSGCAPQRAVALRLSLATRGHRLLRLRRHGQAPLRRHLLDHVPASLRLGRYDSARRVAVSRGRRDLRTARPDLLVSMGADAFRFPALWEQLPHVRRLSLRARRHIARAPSRSASHIRDR